MSVGSVRNNFANALQDNTITAEDAAKILSTRDRITEAPDSVGTFVDQDEYLAIKSLHQDIVSGKVKAESGVEGMLRGFVDAGPDSRLEKIGERAAGWGTAGALVGGIWNGGLGAPAGGAIGASFGAVYGLLTGITDD